MVSGKKNSSDLWKYEKVQHIVFQISRGIAFNKNDYEVEEFSPQKRKGKLTPHVGRHWVENDFNFFPGRLRLCSGIERNPTNFQISRILRRNENQILIEKIENEIVLRSRNCRFAVPEENGSHICAECRKVKEVGLLLKRRKLGSRNCEKVSEMELEVKEESDSFDECGKNFFSKCKRTKNNFSSCANLSPSNSKSKNETKLFAQMKTTTCSVLLRPVPTEIIQRLTGKLISDITKLIMFYLKLKSILANKIFTFTISFND